MSMKLGRQQKISHKSFDAQGGKTTKECFSFLLWDVFKHAQKERIV